MSDIISEIHGDQGDAADQGQQTGGGVVAAPTLYGPLQGVDPNGAPLFVIYLGENSRAYVQTVSDTPAPGRPSNLSLDGSVPPSGRSPQPTPSSITLSVGAQGLAAPALSGLAVSVTGPVTIEHDWLESEIAAMGAGLFAVWAIVTWPAGEIDYFPCEPIEVLAAPTLAIS
jgi:hypothetical protein